ncbi:hypothetical protein Efla_000790 [Eimeria flavescens]
MHARKHIFPRPELRYLPSNHPLLPPSPAAANQQQQQQQEEEEAMFGFGDLAEQEGVARSGVFSVSPSRPRIRQSLRGRKKKGGGFLFDSDSNAVYVEDRSYLGKVKKGEGRVWVAKRRDVPLGRKRLLLLLRLIKGLHLTDAIDWLHAVSNHKCNSLLNVLLKQQQIIRDEGADPSRVYIHSYIIGPAGHIKTMRVGYHYRVSFLKSYRYSLSLRLRELPLHELYHRLFVMKKVPRSLGQEMRMAIRQQQVPREVVRDWLPFLDAPCRFAHKQRLRQLNRQRLFNYFLSRRAFVCIYTSRVRRMGEEAAAARGLTLHAIQQSLGTKCQLKGLEFPEN